MQHRCHSAGDTDSLRLSIGGSAFFINNATAVGTSFTTGVLAAGIYKLSLDDVTVTNTWSSDPTLNSDHSPHLASTTNFADFGIGSPAPVPAGMYYGWEDRPFPTSDGDYNDLVFTVATVPEPATLALLGAGLFGLGAARRRRA